jgi:hypothetical protein
MNCPFDDFVVLLLWFIRHEECVWQAACNKFTGLSERMGMKEFGSWCKTESGIDSFYNGLELVRWFWLRRRNT